MQFKAWVCDRSLAGIINSNPAGGMDVFVNDEFCKVQVSETDRLLIQKIHTEFGVSE